MQKTKELSTDQIQELREKYKTSAANLKKLEETLQKVTAKIEKLEADMARFVFAVKDAETEYRSAEKQCIRGEIAETDLEKIAKKQDDSVKAMHDAERALNVAKQVINDLNHEIRTAVEKMNIARQRLSSAMRAEMVAKLPEDISEKLLQIHATYPDKRWESTLYEVFKEPHPLKIKEAQAEFNKGLK